MTKIVPAFVQAFKVFRDISSLHVCKLREVHSVTLSHRGENGLNKGRTCGGHRSQQWLVGAGVCVYGGANSRLVTANE